MGTERYQNIERRGLRHVHMKNCGTEKIGKSKVFRDIPQLLGPMAVPVRPCRVERLDLS
jgi:hypothetical protein